MESAAAAAKSHQSCPTLCDSIDGSPPGSSIPAQLLPSLAILSFISGYPPVLWYKLKCGIHSLFVNLDNCIILQDSTSISYPL